MEDTGGVRGEKTNTPGFPYKSEAATPILTIEPLFGTATVQILVPTSVPSMFVYVPSEYCKAMYGLFPHNDSLELIT